MPTWYRTDFVTVGNILAYPLVRYKRNVLLLRTIFSRYLDEWCALRTSVFLEKVTYCATGFLEKNNDTLQEDLRGLLLSSSIPFLKEVRGAVGGGEDVHPSPGLKMFLSFFFLGEDDAG